MSPAAQKKANEFQIFLHAMQEVLGVVVDEENQKTVSQKLVPVMEHYGHGSLEDLAQGMRDDEDNSLCLSVLQAITEHDSVWFDYPEVASLLNEYVLPGVINKNAADFRIWLVGCGHGPIAYSLAMTIDEFKSQYGMACNIEVVASDLSEETVKQASEGRYTESMLSGLPTALRQRYMAEDNGFWTVDESLRSTIHFTTCDLPGGVGGMGHCDLIICPDELIYFSNAVKTEILSGFADLLDPSGMLIVGANEPVVPFCDQFEIVNHESGVFYRQLPDA
jgi:chemotaxis methyl-accepting protein methylase